MCKTSKTRKEKYPKYYMGTKRKSEIARKREREREREIDHELFGFLCTLSNTNDYAYKNHSPRTISKPRPT